MERREVIESLVRVRNGAAVLTGPGASAGILFELSDEPATIYNMDMAYTIPVAMGIALAAPTERAVAVEGDGSLIAALGVLTTVGLLQPPNLVMLIMDNGLYASSGDGTTKTAAGRGLDLCAVAIAAGVPEDRVVKVTNVEEADRALERAMTEPGPWFVHALLGMTEGESGWRPSRIKPTRDIVETAGAMKAEMLRRGHGVNWTNRV